MSDFDTHAAAFAGDLVAHMGRDKAVEIIDDRGRDKFAAIVGDLRQEEVVVAIGTEERFSLRDVCKVSVVCHEGRISMKSRLIVFKHSDGTISSLDQQSFYVRSIDSVSPEMTTVHVWRESLTKIQRRGTEIGRN